VLSNKSLGIAVAAIAVVGGLMLGVAGPGRAQDTKAPDKAPGPQFKDNAEYQLADGASKEADPAKRLGLLQQWKEKYPTTEYADARQDMFLVAYQQSNQARQAFDQALDILKTRPNHFRALLATVQLVGAIKPAPTPADLDTAEKNANVFLDNPDKVFDPANKPGDMTDAQWAQAKTAIKPIAENVLINIYYDLRKDDKRAVDDLTKLIKRDPTLAVASYRLGQTMMKILGAEKRPADQPPALYQIARAVAYDGPNALPANQKPAIQTFLSNAYKTFHGSTDGLSDLLATAKANPFPPANFDIESTVQIAQKQADAVKAEQDKDPIMFAWIHTIKENLATKGDAFWENVKDAELPGADPADTSTPPAHRFYKAHIISISPDPKPKELLVGIEKPNVADAKIVFFDKKETLEGRMEPGSEIEFWGAAKEYTKDPTVMITFEIGDPKTDIKGWTGKNPATNSKGAKGAGTGAKSTAAPKAPAAPKQ
jgi:hypothetical protein